MQTLKRIHAIVGYPPDVKLEMVMSMTFGGSVRTIVSNVYTFNEETLTESLREWLYDPSSAF